MSGQVRPWDKSGPETSPALRHFKTSLALRHVKTSPALRHVKTSPALRQVQPWDKSGHVQPQDASGRVKKLACFNWFLLIGLYLIVSIFWPLFITQGLEVNILFFYHVDSSSNLHTFHKYFFSHMAKKVPFDPILLQLWECLICNCALRDGRLSSWEGVAGYLFSSLNLL